MKTKLFLGMLTAAATLAVAPAVFADNPEVNDNFSIEYTRGQLSKDEGGSFTGTSYTTTGEVGNYTLDLTGSGNVYFTGEGTLTITSIDGTGSSSTTTNISTHDSFIVEGTTVIIDGGATENNSYTSSIDSELGLNLCIGTMESATLKITGGAKVSTGAHLSTVGANLATGTIIIDGTGSTLATQQITLGSAADSLTGIGENPDSSGHAETGDYWTRDMMYADDETYDAALATLTGEDYDSTSGSYGIVKVTDGGTWTVGVGNSDSSNSRLQLSNGEITIDGSGSQLLLGGRSSLMMSGTGAINSDGNNVTGVHYTEKITVTDGGKVACAENANLYQITIGDNYYASTDVVEISVSGKDTSGNASTFDLAISGTAWIGSYAGYWDSTTGALDGGTENVKITASEGGVFKISADGGIVVAGDNYMKDFGGKSTAGHSYGLTVDITAESGGSLTLESDKDEIILGSGSPATKDAAGAEANYTNNVNVTADGEGSSVLLSTAFTITTNMEKADSVYITLKATEGGAMTISATQGTTLNKNTAVIVEKGSSLTTEGTVLFNEGSSISVDGTSKWAGKNVEFASGSSLSITAGASAITTLDGDASANVSLGEVTIAQGASITVTIDISSLDNYTEASVAILTANSIVFDYAADTQSGETLVAGNTITGDDGYSDTLASFVEDYIVYEQNGFTIDSWSYTDGTLYANISTTPEPSMFGMLFGLSALGLVSTRRRRRKA